MNKMNKTLFKAESHAANSRLEYFFLEEVQFIQVGEHCTNVYFYNSRVLGITLESGIKLVDAINNLYNHNIQPSNSNIEREKIYVLARLENE